MVECPMPLQIDPSKASHLFFPQEHRRCLACGEVQRYDYKSSGRYFYRLNGLYYVDGQIVYCHNGSCPLRYKPIHPPEELSLAPPLKGHGFDVIAFIGHLRHREALTRPEIKIRLARDYPALVISERQIQNLYELYGALVSGSTLTDPDVLSVLKKNKALVPSLDGAKPMRDNDSVWFVRDMISGITLAAQAMSSCTTDSLVRLLLPIKELARAHKLSVPGVISDKEAVNVAAVRRVFPKARHQYCQQHFVSNLAEPVVKADRELRTGLKDSMRDLSKIEKSMKSDAGPGKSLTVAQGELLSKLFLAIRSVLRDNAKPPFDPPGLRLLERLKNLRQLLSQIEREKGGPIFGRLPTSWRSPISSSQRDEPSAPSTRTSGMSKGYSSRKARPRRVPRDS